MSYLGLWKLIYAMHQNLIQQRSKPSLLVPCTDIAKWPFVYGYDVKFEDKLSHSRRWAAVKLRMLVLGLALWSL
jgi:hypothetical protein